MPETAEKTTRQKILVIEDELNVLELVKFRLEENNYQVETAEDGYSALAMVRTFMPDLIILDLMLPKIDGYTVCRLLKFNDQFRHIPVIMFTARTNPDDEKRGYECGADAYIPKPFEPKILLDRIKSLIKKES
ncbi:MAG: response regulator transcription factor [bacterium]|nr:response regulator [candidate division WOR-3 bacterium]MDH5683911.1 response regulator [candidate division WOR-3 bacterium]